MFWTADRAAYFFLDGGDFDSSCQQIERVLLLIRLGSESTEKACDSEEEELVQNGGRTTEDQDFIYVFTPPSQVSELCPFFVSLLPFYSLFLFLFSTFPSPLLPSPLFPSPLLPLLPSSHSLLSFPSLILTIF